MGKNNLGLAIVRVSSKRQEDNISHDLQERKIKKYCSEFGITLSRVVKIVESAKRSDERKKYSEALNSALVQNIRHVLFYMNDREARNLTDNEKNEAHVLDDKIAIHYVNERKVLHKDSPSSDFFTRDIYAVTNKHFSRVLSEKIIDVMTKKAEDGWFPGNHPPLGYEHMRLKGPDGRNLKRGTVIVPSSNEKILLLVKSEFELRAKKYSYDEIRSHNLSNGLVPKYLENSYSRAAIEKRLKNKFYRGEFIWREQLYEGKHELIIDKQTLELVDESFGATKRPIKTKFNENGLFGRGWLKCGVVKCNCNIVYDPKTKMIKSTGDQKVYHLYHCTNGRKIHPSLKGMNIHEDSLWTQFGGAVDRISISKEWAEQIANALNELFKKVKANRKNEMAGYKQGLSALETSEDDLYKHFTNGILDEAAYKRQITHIRNERTRLTSLLENANNHIDDVCQETAQSILELASNAKSLWLTRTAKERLEFLDMLLSNPRLEGSTVRYDFKKPFFVLAKMRENESWRARRDSNSRPTGSKPVTLSN